MTFPHDPNPLVAAPLLANGIHPAAAPIKGSLSRPDFRGTPEQQPDPGAVRTETEARLRESAERADAARQRDADRRAAMPTTEQRLNSLEVAVIELKVRSDCLEAARKPAPPKVGRISGRRPDLPVAA